METTILIIFGFLIALTTGIVYANNAYLRRKIKEIKRDYRSQDQFIKMQSDVISELENELFDACKRIERYKPKRDSQGRFMSKKGDTSCEN